MANDPSQINFAKFYGIESVPAAAVFAALYVPLLCWFVRQSFRNPTYVHVILAFFCSLRVSGFAIRAVLAAKESAGENLGMLIADQILFGVGFFGLLYSAYTLVLDRELLAGHPSSNNRILQLTRNRFLFRIALSAAVILGITSASMTDATHSSANDSTIKSLHVASTIIFFVLTVLQAFQTLLLSRMEISGKREYSNKETKKVGVKYAIYILLVISVLLLIREAFAMATVNDAKKQNNEHFWYPFIAVPEILAVILYSIPGLVPARSELPT